jgi:allantoinase
MTTLDTVLRAERAVVGGAERPTAIGIRDGRIAVVARRGAALAAAREVRVGDDVVVLPGLVDTHVHLQDPGREGWEGFDSGTRAAAAGGVTTVLDMPVDSVPATVSPAALAAKRAAAAGRCHVDVGFWAGVTPGNLGRLGAMAEGGVFGFKCFLNDSGAPDLPALTVAQLHAALAEIGAFGGLLLVHAEFDAPDAGHARIACYADFLAARPAGTEVDAVAAVVDAVRATGTRCHIVHVSTGEAAGLVAAARRAGLPVSAETCPHYLAIRAEQIPDGDTSFKVSPPIRPAADAEPLWRHLDGGVLDMVVSDHSPGPVGLRDGDFATASGGIASVQLSLAVTWTAARARGYPLTRVVDWMATRPAAVAGLPGKGAIAPGYDADLCLLAPDESFVVDPAALHHRQHTTPYAGRTLSGVVRQTWLRGRLVTAAATDTAATAAVPRGRLLTR